MIVNALRFTKMCCFLTNVDPTEKESQGLDSAKNSPCINFKR